MAQIFRPRTNTVARASMVGVLLLLALLGWGVHAVYWSPYMTREGVAMEQPVPFSHKHHVSGLGIDCRYCHYSVESSAFAGIPSMDTCMTCHSQLWTQAAVLRPVRESMARGRAVKWNRVHDLPDFVYFDHSIHVAKGVGCSTCHGRVDQMPLTWKTHSLYMKWCLECHRQPASFIRPRAEVFNMAWEPPADQQRQGARLVAQYGINTSQLTDCGICHR